ncbi:peptidylprolyl isomerase [Candidatus Pelagibacter sp.]|nr:peptidylprolyl isomerase [Candidatus Pelagibacter sp.]MDA9663444.1 peptidylprolyl isomerase [Candidatus Pelagibacter sp.]
MKYRIFIKKIFISIVFYSICFFNTLNSAEEVFIVLKIDNEIITNADIEKESRYLIALNSGLKQLEKAQIINLARNSLVREKIKKNELVKFYKFGEESRYVNKVLKDLYLRLNISTEEDFSKYIAQFDLKLEDVKQKLLIETMWNDLIFNRYDKRVEIDKKKLEKKIKDQIRENKTQISYLLSEILFNEDDKKKSDNKLKLINESISKIGFKNTATSYSQSDSSKLGGDIGWVEENQLSDEIRKQLSILKINEHTPPISIPGGFLLLMIEEKKETKIKLNFENEFKKLFLAEKNRQLNQFSAIFFNKLKSNSNVTQ